MSYRPIFRRQIGDPTTTLDSFICTMESSAMALDFHTMGDVQKWGGELVPWCGETTAHIKAHGTNLHDAAQAWRHWGQTLDIRTGGTWADLEHALHEQRAVVFQEDYDAYTLSERCQDSFLGNHAQFLLPEWSGTAILSGDPLCGGYRYIEARDLRKAGEKLGREAGLPGGEAHQGIFFAVTRPELPDTSTGGDMFPWDDPVPRIIDIPVGTQFYAEDGITPVVKVQSGGNGIYSGHAIGNDYAAYGSTGGVKQLFRVRKAACKNVRLYTGGDVIHTVTLQVDGTPKATVNV